MLQCVAVDVAVESFNVVALVAVKIGGEDFVKGTLGNS
jgi:hypothetical protein